MPKENAKTLGKWKTIRVRRANLDRLRATVRANPCPKSFVPFFDVKSVNDSTLFDISCELSINQINGRLFKDVEQKLYRWMDILQQNGAAQVAANFGASIRKEPDGSFVLIKARGREIPLPPLPAPELPREMFI